jgi:threonine dehydratase
VSEVAEELPTPAEVFAARHRLREHARTTPLQASPALAEAAGMDVLLKLECWQLTGSFKVRGALNAVASLSVDERSRGLATASAGNHGQAVALAARRFGCSATVFVPADAPEVKKARIRGHGARLDAESRDYDHAEARARAWAEQHGAVFVHAFSDRSVMAGQGTVALELLESPQAAGMTDVVIPVGGGGLVTGMGAMLKAVLPGVRIIGVQSTETRAMHEAFAAGRAVDVPVPPTLADGLAGCTDEATYRLARQVVDELMLVEEAEIEDAIRMLHAREGVIAEGAGAVAVAALLTGRIRPGGPTVAVVSGGNIDGNRLASVLGRTA